MENRWCHVVSLDQEPHFYNVEKFELFNMGKEKGEYDSNDM